MPVTERPDVNDTIGLLYDLAVEDDEPSALLTFLAETLHAGSGVLNQIRPGSVIAGAVHNLPQVPHHQFAKAFGLLDPEAGNPRPSGSTHGVTRGWDIPLRALAQSNAIPPGWGSEQAIGCTLPTKHGLYRIALLGPADAPFDAGDREHFEALLPHVSRALQFQQSLRLRSGWDAQAALEALAVGVAVCNREGFVRYMNAAAERFVETASGLTLLNAPARLTAVGHAARPRLAELMHNAADSGQSGAVRLPERDQEQILLLVTPAPQRFSERDGSVLILMRSTARTRPPSQRTLQDLFGLSGAEATLAAGLWNGDTIADLVRDRGVADSTIRSQLASAFRKTGVSGQSGLIRLINLVPHVHPTAGAGGLGL